MERNDVAGAKKSYGKLTVVPVPKNGVDNAWSQGASDLAKACETSYEGITPELLKYMLLRGDKFLFAVVEQLENGGTEPRGWFVASVIQNPTHNAFFVYAAVGQGCTTEDVISQLKAIAKQNGCTKIQCSTSIEKLVARYQEVGFAPIYQTLSMEC